MMIRLHPKAEDDLNYALDYYYNIDPKLENRFLDTLDETFEKIKKFPNLYPFETKTTQKCVMDIFPFIVLYEKYEDIIMILAIFHTRRDSKNLQERENIT